MNTATGALSESMVDFSLPGVGPSFNASRTYNSNDTTVGLTGKGWSSPYSARLAVGTSSVTYVAEDGQEVVYQLEAGSYRTPPGVTSRLQARAGGGFELVTKSHELLTFDTSGRLVSSKDSSGQGVTLAYAGGELDTVTDALGRVVDVELDANGRMVSAALPDGREVSYGYTGDLLTSVTDMRGGVTEYEYDTADRLVAVIDPLGNEVVRSVYDGQGRVIEQTDATGGETTFAYTNSGGQRVTTTTDPRDGVTVDTYAGNLLIETQTPGGAVTTYHYDSRARLTSVVDPHARATTMAYDPNDNLISRTYANGDVEEFTYSPAGDLLTETSPEERTTTYEYDAAHRVVEITDAADGVTSFTYEADGQEKTRTSPEARTTTHEYDTAGNRTATISPEGRRTSFAYDAYGRLTSQISPRGHVTGADPADFTTTHTYDAGDNLLTSTDPAGGVTEHEYDLAGRLTATIDPLDRRTEYGYDDAGRLTTVTDPGNGVTTHAYDEAGNRVSTTDPEGGKTTWTYDPDGRVASMTTPRGNEAGADPADFTWTYEYDGLGNLVEETDPDGRVTTYGYDQRYRQTSVTDPLDNTTTTAYDGDGNAVSVTDPLGRVTETVYNDLNLPVSVTDPDSHTTTSAYDADGLLLSQTTPLGHESSYTHDDDGLLVGRTTPKGNASTNPAAHTWTRAYDADGNLTTETDPMGGTTTSVYDRRGVVTSTTDPTGRVTSYTYDAAGQLVEVEGPDAAVTSYAYSPLGDLATVTDPNENTQTITRDGLGRATAVTDGLGRTTAFGYDADGNRDRIIRARGPASGDPADWTINYGHDARGLVTSVTSGQGTSYTYGYDDAGRMTSYTDAGGTTNLGYDDAGQLTSVTRGSSGYAYSYNDRGLIATVDYPDGGEATYGYDADGRRTSMTMPGSPQRRFGYDANSNLVRTEHYNSSALVKEPVQTRTYDRADRQTHIRFGPVTRMVPYIAYQRDAAGRPTQMTEGRSQSTTVNIDEVQSYLYDDAGRLSDVCFLPAPGACTAAAAQRVSYTYDGAGNRLTEQRVGVPGPGTFTYTYDDANQLTARNSITYTYDADGNLASDGATSWEHNEFNQLVAVDRVAASIELTYDALGNRTSSRNGLVNRALSWDLNAPIPLLSSIDVGGTDTAYRHDPTGAPVWINDNGTQASLFTDALGSVKQAVIGAANSAWTTSYEPFGRPRNTAADELTTTDIGVGFTGQYSDPGTRLLHLRLRDYNPDHGRFTATDPIATPLGAPAVSPYAYVNNQPTVLTDPTGACPWCVDLVGDAVVGITGAIDDEGMPSHSQLQAGFGIGIAQAAESTAHSFIAGSNPWGLTNSSGWDGNWVTSKIEPYDHGWFHGATIAGQIGFHAGLAAASIPFAARTATTTLTTRICPPGLLVPRAGVTASKASDIAANLTRPVTVLGRFYGGTQNYMGKPGFRVLDVPFKGPGRWNWTRNKRFIDEALENRDTIWLVTNPDEPLYVGGNVYQRELRYLRDRGYMWMRSGDHWIVVKQRG